MNFDFRSLPPSVVLLLFWSFVVIVQFSTVVEKNPSTITKTVQFQATPGLVLPTCLRRDRSKLSDLAAAVLNNIENTTGTIANSPVERSLILSTCNRFHSIRVDGPAIYAAVRDVITKAEHEVDIAFYQWEDKSHAVSLIGAGLIAAQARRTSDNPLLVRIMIDDVDNPTDPNRAINRLGDSQKRWVARGLDTSRVRLQFATSDRLTWVAANLHDKFVVVDAKHLVVTGANPEVVHDPPRPWHDSGYVLEGDIGRAAVSAFDQTWTTDADHWDCRKEALSKDCDKREKYPQPTRAWLTAGANRPGDIPILAVGRRKGKTLPPNNDTNNPQDIAWLTVMDNARSHIHIETPNINDDAFRDAVVRAVGRGVTVRLITSLGFNEGGTNLPFMGGGNQEVVGDLRQKIRRQFPQHQKQFEVRWFSPNRIEPIAGNGPRASHTKYMSVDNRVAIVGSGNMETPAWNFSHEFNILIDDASVTQRLERDLFRRDWGSSIDSYIELYEGNDGNQDAHCTIAVNRTKFVSFPNTLFCDNDKTRSLLLHNVPAGRVLRFYNDSNRRYQDDAWTEIIVKRSVQRKFINSYEQSFEDADVRVIAHQDDGLDGKVSSAEIAMNPIGTIVDLYEGNNGRQNLVCSNRIRDTQTINFTRDLHCNNDEARSLKIYDFPANKVIFLYDDSNGNREDDWAVIVPKRKIFEATVDSFERSFQNSSLAVWYFGSDGLDGKVSRMRIGNRSELIPVASFYEGVNASQNKVCDVSIGNKTVKFKGSSRCKNDEAKSLQLTFAVAGTVVEVFDNSDCTKNDAWTRIQLKRNIGRKIIDDFERPFSDADVDVRFHHKNGKLKGKVSCVRISVP